MRPLRTILIAASLCWLPVGAQGLAQDAGTTVLPAPKGHAQPRRADVPNKPGENAAGTVEDDAPARLQDRLKGSDDRAIRSICADCLPHERTNP